MVRFEYHEDGIQVLTLSEQDLDVIRDGSENLFDQLQHHRAAVTGSTQPFSLIVTSSWSTGYPFLTLNEDGATEIEVDPGAVAFTSEGSVRISNLTVRVEGHRIVIEEGAETVRETITDAPIEVEASDVIELLRRHPVEAHAMRLHFRQNDPAEVEEVVKRLRDSRRVRFDGDTYFLIGDQRVTHAPVPRKLAGDIRRALQANASSPKTVEEVCKIMGLSLEEADIALEALVREGRVFLREGYFSLPEPEDRRTLGALIVEELFNAEDGMTAEQIAVNLHTYHPAWITRQADLLVYQKRLGVVDGRYQFARTERSNRSNGYGRVRSVIKEAHEAGTTLTITAIYERFPELPQWLIRQNVRTLIEMGKIKMDEAEVITWSRKPQKATKRVSFQDEIRAYLQQAGEKGVRRDVLLDHFSDRGRGKASIALSNMCTHGQATFNNGVYHHTNRAPTTFDAPLSRANI